MKTKSDKQLMVEYAAGNPRAFEELFRRYGKRVYNLFLRSFNKTELAQDLLQECFVRVVESRNRYEPTKAFSNWIFTIAMNLIRDKYREQARRKTESMSASRVMSNPSPASAGGGPHQELEEAQTRMAVVAAINALPNDQREVIILHKYEGLSFSEIAAILDSSPEAAKQKAYRAMQSLRKKLAYLKED